jgi:GH35 family endo-1,4-beta-xylanase
MSINDVGIEISNNKSQLIENLIEKSHENGVKVMSEGELLCQPNIWKNRIT